MVIMSFRRSDAFEPITARATQISRRRTFTKPPKPSLLRWIFRPRGATVAVDLNGTEP
jgi:hypothetical protein